MNDLYRHELRLLQNLFLPSVKLVRKERIGARLRRRYDAPRTPLDRLLQACPGVDPAPVASWVALRDQLDPFTLSQAIDRKIERLVALAPVRRTRPTPPPGTLTGTTTERIVRRRRPPPPRHLKTPFTFGNRLRRPLGQPPRVTS